MCVQKDASNALNVTVAHFCPIRVSCWLSLAVVLLLQDSKQMPPLCGQQQLPKAVTDLGDRVEQQGGAGAGARGLTPAAASPPVEQLLRQERSEPSLSGAATCPTAASKIELSLQSGRDDESSSTRPNISTAAAEATSAKQLVCEMRAQIAALGIEKTQLSAQLSAARSSIQELRDAEALGTASTVMLGKAAEEDVGQQRQLASEVTKVCRMAFSIVRSWRHAFTLCSVQLTHSNMCDFGGQDQFANARCFTHLLSGVSWLPVSCRPYPR